MASLKLLKVKILANGLNSGRSYIWNHNPLFRAFVPRALALPWANISMLHPRLWIWLIHIQLCFTIKFWEKNEDKLLSTMWPLFEDSTRCFNIMTWIYTSCFHQRYWEALITTWHWLHHITMVSISSSISSFLWYHLTQGHTWLHIWLTINKWKLKERKKEKRGHSCSERRYSVNIFFPDNITTFIITFQQH